MCVLYERKCASNNNKKEGNANEKHKRLLGARKEAGAGGAGARAVAPEAGATLMSFEKPWHR